MVTFDGYDVELSRGDTLAIKIDLSGRDLPEGTDGVFTIKKRVKDDEVVLQKRFDASDETLTVVLDADETNIEPGTYYWDVRLQIPAEDGGYEVYTPMEYAAFVVLPVVGVDIGVDGSNMVNPDLPVLQVILSDSKRALAEMQDALGSIESLKTLVNDAENSVVAANAATERAEQAAQKWEDSTAANAEKLGGIPAENYLQKTETSADSSKLGGKAPEYYLSPRNLLDNSDFTNPVNQRGATSYNTEWAYAIDRWLLPAINEPFAVIDGYVSFDTVDQFVGTVLADGYYTAAICLLDGRIFVGSGYYTIGASMTLIGSTGVVDCYLLGDAGSGGHPRIRFQTLTGEAISVKWAALYEGAYTAETLPPYVPKENELAACKRRFRRIGKAKTSDALVFNGYVTTSGKEIIVAIDGIEDMSNVDPTNSKPTVSYSGKIVIRGTAGYCEDATASSPMTGAIITAKYTDIGVGALLIKKSDGSAFAGLTNSTVVAVTFTEGSYIDISNDL